MFHIQAKQHQNPPTFLTMKLSPVDPIPPDVRVKDYGVDTLAPGASTDFHHHDCDEWWIIADGVARAVCPDREIEVGPGDMVFTPRGESHRLEAITLVRVVWFEGHLQGQD
jgi:mannose-6-phosphate isomerase-like protein (cupin superfamily)